MLMNNLRYILTLWAKGEHTPEQIHFAENFFPGHVEHMIHLHEHPWGYDDGNMTNFYYFAEWYANGMMDLVANSAFEGAKFIPYDVFGMLVQDHAR